MNRKFLGDSYDCVKSSVMRWLGDGGTPGWALLPMVGLQTPDAIKWTKSDFRSYETLLGGKLVDDTTWLPPNFRDRAAWFPEVGRKIAAAGHRRVFVDPDKGFSPGQPGPQAASPTWHPRVYPGEITSIWQEHTELIAVFDQSFNRAANRCDLLREKLRALAVDERTALAYDAGHIAIHVVGSAKAVDDAKQQLGKHLPAHRLHQTRE